MPNTFTILVCPSILQALSAPVASSVLLLPCPIWAIVLFQYYLYSLPVYCHTSHNISVSQARLCLFPFMPILISIIHMPLYLDIMSCNAKNWHWWRWIPWRLRSTVIATSVVQTNADESSQNHESSFNRPWPLWKGLYNAYFHPWTLPCEV